MELSRLLRRAAGIVLVAAAAASQEPPKPEAAVLENTGKPMRLPFQCTEDDIQWAGMSCSEQEPCPVYLELTGVETAGNRWFALADIHSQTVTLYGVLLGSDDTGKTWHESHQRIRGAGFDHIQFSDLANGWVTGEALSPLPQDPFLLITSDGGSTWRDRPLFAASKVGSIQQFQFTSKTDGSLVWDRGRGGDGERYERYDSSDGGETWTLAESSNGGIRLKGTPAAPSWRVQADVATQSFRIEHQQAGRWAAMAAFAVSLGSCAPPERQPAPEPAAPSPDQDARPGPPPKKK